MKKVIYVALFLALVGIGFSSCEKEEVINSSKGIIEDKSILSFENFEELNKELQKVAELNEDERRVYEKNKGFTSLLTFAYENYEKLDLENIKSVEDIESFVAQNNSIVALEPNSEREMVFFPYYVDNIFSLLANTNRVFVVGEYFYKVFEDGIGVTKKENFEKLIAINEIYLSKVSQNNWLISTIFFTNELNDRASCNNAVDMTGTSENGNNRTTVRVSTASVTSGGIKYAYLTGTIKPYKRTLGVWGPAKRTMDGRLKATADYNAVLNGNGTVHTLSLNQTVAGYKAYSYSASVNNTWSSSYIINRPALKSVDSWGDTPDTPNAVLYCN